MSAPKESTTTFHMLSRPKDEDIINRIAKQTDLPAGRVKKSDMSNLQKWFFSVERPPFPLRLVDYVASSPIDVSETCQTISQSMEFFEGTFPLAMSYGLFMPSYQEALRDQKERRDEKSETHTSLLLGALTPDTVREYAIAVRDVYADAKCHVIDIKGGKTRGTLTEAVDFHLGSALDLPFEDGTIDSVQTNFLIDHIEDKTISTVKGRHMEVFREAHRVLNTEGELVMIEIGKPYFEPMLYQVGFRDVTINDSEMFLTRRAMENFLCSTAKDPLPHTTARMHRDTSALIVARK